MAQITASLVKQLREMTGLPMMECKKALADSGGDLNKAEQLLRIKSGAKASKVAGRFAAQGVVGAYLSPDAKRAALVELNCETDFVAKHEAFAAFAATLAELVATRNPVDVAALTRTDGVEQWLQAMIQKIGENISIRRFHRMDAQGKLALYVHHGSRIGVLVDFEGGDDVGRDLAMHIAFARPQYASKGDVPGEVVARERDVLAARAKESGKPEAIVAKMIEGGIGKFLAEITLLGQPFVKDDRQSVEKLLATKGSRVFGYRFLVVGEGLARSSH